MGERAPVSTEDTLVRYDNPVLVTKQPEKAVSLIYLYSLRYFAKRKRYAIPKNAAIINS